MYVDMSEECEVKYDQGQFAPGRVGIGTDDRSKPKLKNPASTRFGVHHVGESLFSMEQPPVGGRRLLLTVEKRNTNCI